MNTPREIPTPITDAARNRFTPYEGGVWASDMEDLERQLAEAREDLEFRRGLYRAQTELLDKTIAERDSLRECVYRCHDAIGESRGSDHTELFKYFDGHAALVARAANVEEQRDEARREAETQRDSAHAAWAERGDTSEKELLPWEKAAIAAVKGGES